MQAIAGSAISGLLPLCDLPLGGKCTIVELSLPASAQGYLMRLGFVPGTEVEVLLKLPFRGPVICRTQGTDTAIRREVAERIRVQMSDAEDAGHP